MIDTIGGVEGLVKTRIRAVRNTNKLCKMRVVLVPFFLKKTYANLDVPKPNQKTVSIARELLTIVNAILKYAIDEGNCLIP